MFNYGNLQSRIRRGPEALLEISNPSNNLKRRKVEAIVDSGAVMTCIPESVISNLGGLEYGTVETQGFDGRRQTLRKYRIFLGIIIHNDNILYNCGEVEVIAVPNKSYALVGRDILNKHKVILDALQDYWGLHCDGSCD